MKLYFYTKEKYIREFSCSLKFKNYAAFILEGDKINQFSLSALPVPAHL